MLQNTVNQEHKVKHKRTCKMLSMLCRIIHYFIYKSSREFGLACKILGTFNESKCLWSYHNLSNVHCGHINILSVKLC